VLHLQLSVTLWPVPTTRPRHVITETDDIARALDDAAQRWPEDQADRKKLLLHLVKEGHEIARAEREKWLAERREAIDRTSGALPGVYEDGYLEKLREDWPE